MVCGVTMTITPSTTGSPQRYFNSLGVAVGVRIAHTSMGLWIIGRGWQGFFQRRLGFGLHLGQHEAIALQGVGSHHARAARIGDDGDAIALEQWLIGEHSRVIKQFLHRFGAQYAAAASGVIARRGAARLPVEETCFGSGAVRPDLTAMMAFCERLDARR